MHTVEIRARPPGLIQHVLTVLVFWSCGLLPRLPPSSRSLRLFPWASILLHGALGHLLGSAARSSPATRAKTGRTAHVFTAQGGTRRRKRPLPRSSEKSEESEKESKTSRKSEKNLTNSHFRLLFELFLTPGPRGPQKPLPKQGKRCRKNWRGLWLFSGIFSRVPSKNSGKLFPASMLEKF